MKIGSLVRPRFWAGGPAPLGVVVFIGERDDFGIRCKVFFSNTPATVGFVDQFEVIHESR